MNRYLLLLFFLLNISGELTSQPVSSPCQAAFTFQQDPGNFLIVNFTNTSLGPVTNFFWDFGDGSTFSGENPSHAFPFPGLFTVCLTVSNSDTLFPCLVTACEEILISDLPVYNLGGLLFAGSFPINNPVSTGDSAFAYLYRIDETGLKPVDSIRFDTLGYFWFPNVREGHYLLKAGLTPASQRFSAFLPAYRGNVLQWFESDTLHIDHHIYNSDIYLVKGTELTTGPGHVTGVLQLDENGGNAGPLRNAQVVLTDGEGHPYRCTYTNGGGFFTFDQIPSGSYQVFGEHTGYYSGRVDLLLDSTNLSADSLSLLVYKEIPGITERNPSDPFDVTVFPNPANRVLNLQFTNRKAQTIRVEIFNLLGKRIALQEFRMPAGSFREGIDLGNLPGDIYLISFTGVETGWLTVKKFVKN